jgi:hypothetical protein
MVLLKNRIDDITAAAFVAAGFLRRSHLSSKPTNPATLLPMFDPGFQQSGEKGCGKSPQYEGNHT